MTGDNLKKTDTVIARIKSYGQLIFVIGSISIGGSIAYYQIFENSRDIESNKADGLKALEQNRKDLDAHIDLLEKRSDKRYRRGVDEGMKIWKYGEGALRRIRDLEIKNARLEERIKLNK